MPITEIRLERCTLRSWRRTDKPDLVRFANNRKIWRNLTHLFPHPYTEADADFWVSLASNAAPSVHFAIEMDGMAIGGVGLAAQEGIFSGTADFGYWLAEPYWGRGIATEVARAMVTHAFTALAFERLEAPVFEWNPASMRVLEKVGFVREGVLRRSAFKDGQFIDRVMYAITR
ncbi:GNAT family N-acetyltransferase [soil metagenome]